MRRRFLIILFIIISILLLFIIQVREITSWLGMLPRNTILNSSVLVLVNSTSEDFIDFEQLIQPYLDHFGIPYNVMDISTVDVGKEIDEYALIITGHNQLDADGKLLDQKEEENISHAVEKGTGLVNFDHDLVFESNLLKHQYIQEIFKFDYYPRQNTTGVEFVDLSGLRQIQFNCWEDLHQDPVIDTTNDSVNVNDKDGKWTEWVDLAVRSYPTIIAGEREEKQGLPVLRCFIDGIPNGEYKVFANLYTGESEREMRYFYGFSADKPKSLFIDTEGGIGGSDLHEEFELNSVVITNNSFEIYFVDGDLMSGNDPYFGWSWIRLVPETKGESKMHWITAGHEAGEKITTGQMTIPSVSYPDDVTVLAYSGMSSLLAVTSYGQGKAVQWGTYDWMSYDVKGPLYGLDDLFWRSLVWAARKPFTLQGFPPMLTMRVDDVSGPFGWIHIANEFNIKPWTGLFFREIDSDEAADLSSLIYSDNATASIHAFDVNFFYYDHDNGDWSEEVIAAHYVEGTEWHLKNDIPISKVVFPHFYEIGTNAFQGLKDWDVEFLGILMDPGTGYGSPWINNGPFRKYSDGISSSGIPLYYADFIEVPEHPEFDRTFFNCVTEIRDDAGYEWYPDNDVDGSIGRGSRQLSRAYNSMALGTLFTHGKYLNNISPENWNAILDGITSDVSSYNPTYVTLDYACQYARCVNTSEITMSEYNQETGNVIINFSGNTDMSTKFYLFFEVDGVIQEKLIDVPPFSDSIQIVHHLE